MNPKIKILNATLATLLCLAVANGQTKASDPTPTETGKTIELPKETDDKGASNPGETITLSPFTVTADKDEGYYASETLGGNRLRADINDLSTSLTLVTKQMMDDLGARGYAELLPYTVGTEAGGIFGNMSGTGNVNSFGQGFPTTFLRQQARARTRIRGVAEADTTRDFNLSRLPIDTYNTERYAIQRGSNAMLFGLGSPGGIIDAQLIIAGFANKNKVELATDDNGTIRTSVDFNRVVVEDKLAVRVAALYKDQEFTQQPTYEKDRRGFLTLTYKPFTNTTIKASAEVGRINSSRPDITGPINSMQKAWFDAGMPLATDAMQAAGWPNVAFPLSFNTLIWNGTAVRIFENSANNTSLNTVLQRGNVLGATGGGNLPAGDGFGNFVRFTTGSYRSQNLNFIGTAGDDPADRFGHQRSQEQGFLDFNNVNFEKIKVFAAEQSKEEFEAYDASFEQLFLRDVVGQSAGINVTYHTEKYKADMYEGQWDGIMSAIMIDVNPFIPVPDPNNAANTLKVPNPNVGRPFVFNWTPQDQVATFEEESMRANLFYEIDPTKGDSRWLGRQTFNVTAATQESFRSDIEAPYHLVPLGNPTQSKQIIDMIGNATSGHSRIANISYVGPSVLGATSYSGLKVTDSANPSILRVGDELDYTLWDRVTQRWVKITGRATQGYRKAGMSLINNESIAAIHQGRFLKDALITTLGWRKDEVDLDVMDVGLDAVGNFRTEQVNARKMKRAASATNEIYSYGAVLHVDKMVKLPSGVNLTLGYNSSENFDPTAVRFSALGHAIPDASGVTKEMTLRLGLMDNKVNIALTHYKTSLKNGSTLTALPSTEIIGEDMIYGMAQAYLSEAERQKNAGNQSVSDSLFATAEKFVAVGQSQPVMSKAMGYNRIGTYTIGLQDITNSRFVADIVGEGWELEVTANPIRGLNLGFNLANQDVEKTNIGQQFVDEWKLMTPSFTPLFGVLENPTIAANKLLNPALDVSTATTYQTRFNRFDGQVQQTLLSNGATAPEAQEWRANLFGNYLFQSGRLKGFGVGGAIRYQSGANIGYHSKAFVNSLGQTIAIGDLSKPIMTPSITQADVWFSYRMKLGESRNLKLQLNVRNAIRGPETIGVIGQPDSPYTNLAQVRMSLPTSYIFSSTLEF